MPILDLPTEADFSEAGLFYLNLAWDQVSDLHRDHDLAEIPTWDDDGSVSDAYWNAARPTMAAALVLMYQGVEFLLKARICGVSPYLLVTGGPRDWPANCQNADTSFSAFRTADAQDLVRIHDTVCQARLDPGFRQRIDTYRQRRNSIAHTVDKSLRVSDVDVAMGILEACHYLSAPLSWPRVRLEHYRRSPIGEALAPDEFLSAVSEEIFMMIGLLQPVAQRNLLGHDKRVRHYLCPECSSSDRNSDWAPKSAVLRPNSPTSTATWCFICDTETNVIRSDCSSCEGNVIAADDRQCLSCGDYE